MQFWDEATVGGGYFFNYSGKAGGASGGVVEFHDATSAGSATFANDGGVVDGAGGGVTLFSSTSEAGNSTFIAYGGWGGGQGGKILFLDDSTGGTATVQIYYNGSLDISGHNPGGVTIGSLEGTGNLFLGANNLTVGSNNLSTIFSGVIQDGGNSGGILGSLTKTGTGILVLSGANTYTGATTVDAGTLQFAGEGSLYSSNTTNWTAANIVVSGGATLALNVGGAGEFDSADVSAISALGTDAGGFKNGAILGLDTTNVGGNFTYGGTLADPNGGANSLGLSKLGTGTLTLTGNNTYTGGTTINGGTLVAANNDALGTGSVTINAGTLLIQTGTTISNSIVLNGGNLAQTFSAGTSLADAINTTSDPGGMQTVAEILDGTTSSVATLQSSFAGFSLASNDVVRLSDVFSLSGVPVIDGLTGETDTFVLQLQIVDVNADSFLGWLDPATNQWVNAVDGNIGGTPFFAGDHVYDPLADFHLGTYGVDTANNTVWAVINHNSEFAAVPEPGTSALLVLGAVAIFLIVCQKKRIA